jgi:hypothetical protein
MKLRDIKLDKSNKAFKFNTKITFISALFIIAFYFFPAFPTIEGFPYWYLIGFFIYLLIFAAKINFIYKILYIIYLAGWVGSILLFIFSCKFNLGTKTKSSTKKYFIYLIFQFLFSIGLIYFGIYILKEGTVMNFQVPEAESLRVYYPEPMIFAIIVAAITAFQIIHFIYILRKELKK